MHRSDEQWSGFTPRIKGCHAHGQAHSVARTVICPTARTDEASLPGGACFSDFFFPHDWSAFYEQVTGVKSCLFFLHSAVVSLSLLLLVMVVSRCCSPPCSIRTLSKPFVALCRLGAVGEVDAASFRMALRRPKPTLTAHPIFRSIVNSQRVFLN